MNIQKNQPAFGYLVNLSLPKGKTAAVNTDNLLLLGEQSNDEFISMHPGTKIISNGETLAFLENKTIAETAEMLGLRVPDNKIDVKA